MSIEAKTVFLRQTEQRLSTEITAADLSKVLAAVADILAQYSMQQADVTDGRQDDLMTAYLSAMEISGRSQKTIERYRYILGRMMQGVQAPTRMITVYHLRQYLSNEKARGIGESTLEGLRQVFSAYFTWLHREGLIPSNPCANLGAIKCPKKIKDVYSETDLERLKLGCKTLRDKAIITFLYSTGCRIGEMIQLNRTDIDLTSLECTVFGKGAKERTVYLSPVAGMLIRDYVAQRRDKNPALFVGKRGRMTTNGVRAMLRELQERTGVDHVHPHKFRRTRATTLIRHGMPVQEVALILGHDKLDTTMGYVVLDKSDVKASYRKFA